MLKRFWNWLLNLLGVSVPEHFDTEPVQSAPMWKLRDKRTLSRMECANKCGLGFREPFAFPAQGFFWKRDRGADDGSGQRLYRLYRARV